VFLVAWRRIEQAPDETEEVLWLYGVARNVVRNMNRSSVRRQRLRDKVVSLGQPEAPAPEVQVVRRAEDRELFAAVAKLKPLDQELLRLRTWEELSHAEIADIVGLSPRSVESRLARARKKLSGLLAVPAGAPWVNGPRPVEEGGER
jgi:RNA polymerase sigma-70 factor (ECF subfamily)